jgi:hypothetical protein
MNGYIKTASSTWSTVKNLYLKTGVSTWSAVQKAWVKTSSGWQQWFGSGPSIESPVTISTNSSMYPATLTGTNHHWNNATSLTYVFQYSYDNATWSNEASPASISNPSSGGSNYEYYAVNTSDFINPTMYFRFAVTATNGTSNSTSISNTVTVTYPAPTISQGVFTGSAYAGSTITYSIGATTNTLSTYSYMFRSDGTFITSGSGSTLTHTTSSADIGYYFYAYTVASGYGGSTTSAYAYSSTVIAYPAPIIATGSWSGTFMAGNFVTYTIGSYSYTTSTTSYIYRSDGTLWDTFSGGSYAFQVYSSDVGYYFYAYTVATGPGGTTTSGTAYSSTVTSGTPPSTPGTPTLTYISANGTTSYNYSATFATSSGTPPITYYLHAYGLSDGFTNIQTTKGPFSSGSTGTFTLPQTSTLWEVAAFATNAYGTSSDSSKSNAA